MPAVDSRRLRSFLAALIVVELAAIIGVIWPTPLAMITQPDLFTNGPASAAVLPILESSGLEKFGEVTARPLFTAARRPSPETLVAPAKFPPGQGIFLGHYRLNGIVFTPKLSIAFITDLNTKQNLAVRPSEKLGDWTLSEIAKERITLTRGQQKKSFALPRTP